MSEQGLEDPADLGHDVRGPAVAVDDVEAALGRITGHEGLGLGPVGLEALADDLGRVVLPLDEGCAADVADAGLLRRLADEVIDGLAARAGPALGQALED